MRSTDRPDGDSQSPTRGRVWDLPTRLFHWLLAALIAFSWWTAEEGQLEWHMWSGYGILTLLLFRLLWGVVGSSTARFAKFIRGPAAVIAYVRDMRGWRAPGHTPLGALSVVALLGLTALQVGLGLFSSDEDGLLLGPLSVLVSFDVSEKVTDLHKDLFDVLLIFIGIHIAAIMFYWLAQRRNLIGPMITGKAALDPAAEPMRPARWWTALLCLLVAVAVTRWIIAGVPPFGT